MKLKINSIEVEFTASEAVEVFPKFLPGLITLVKEIRCFIQEVTELEKKKCSSCPHFYIDSSVAP